MAKRRYAITASAFDSKGRLICTKQNMYTKTHPLQKHFANIAGEPFKESLHAEIHCLISSRGIPVNKLVVMRYNSDGKFQLARPCNTCMAAIRAYGIKEVYYSTPEGMVQLVH